MWVKRNRNVLVVFLMLLTVVIFGVSMVGLNIVPGYEGSKMYLKAIRWNGQLYWGDEPGPEGASIWVLQEGYAELDPDWENAGYQNLIVTVQTSGQIEETPWGEEIADVYRWEEKINETHTKVIEAVATYWIHDISLTVRVDEGATIFGTGETEKGNPWEKFALIFQVELSRFIPTGNLTDESFDGILGVEVVDFRWEKEGKNMVVVTGFQGGQMLPMYTKLGGKRIQPILPGNLKGSDPYPDQFVRSVWVELPFSSFGVRAGPWDEWEPGVYHVIIRVHVLSVNKWLIVQEKGGEYKPPESEDTPPPPPTLWDILRNTFGLPNFDWWIWLLIFLGIGIIILGIIMFIFVGVTMKNVS